MNLTSREAFNLAEITAKEELIEKIITGLNGELQVIRIQKEAIFKAYKLPTDKTFDFDEDKNEVTINED